MHSNVLEEFENYIKANVIENRGKKRKLSVSNSIISNTLKQQKLILFSSNSKQKQFDTNVLNYVICSMKPLSTVEDEHFRKMINGMFIYINKSNFMNILNI